MKFCRDGGHAHAGVEVDPVPDWSLRSRQRPAWRRRTGDEYRPADGRYRIEMPGTPEEETVPTPVQGEKVPMMQAMVAESDVVYLVGYIDYPAEAMQGHDAAKALEAARDAVAKGHKLLSDRALTVSGQPAREFVIEQPKGLVLVMRIVFVGERLLPDGRGHGDARRHRRPPATHDASSALQARYRPRSDAAT